jgi:myo-inositol-1(or 4)-monophosphatase
MAWISCGRADGFWEFRLNPWDVAAGMLLVEEAGGQITDFNGQKWDAPKSFGLETLASNGLIHKEMATFFKTGKSGKFGL